MKVVIVVRNCPNYLEINSSNISQQTLVPYCQKDKLDTLITHDVFNIWNKSFLLSLSNYRKELSDIALKSFENTGCEIIKGHQSFNDWYSKEQTDCVIVPVNDDDWLSPDLFKIGNLIDQGDIIVWKKTLLHAITKFMFESCPGHTLRSNSWGIKLSFLKKTFSDIAAKDLILLNHNYADHQISNYYSKNNTVLSDEPLSVYLRHIASLRFIESLVEKNRRID